MNERIIKSILNKKLDALIESINNTEIKQTIKEQSFITGGCIASMLLNEKVRDFDMYFISADAAKKVADYYLAQFKEDNKSQSQQIEKILSRITQIINDRVSIMIKSAGILSETQESDYQYFETLEDNNPAQEQYVNELAKALKTTEKKKDAKPFRPIVITQNAISLSDKIQMTLRFCGTPDKVHQNFDYIHCTGWWSKTDNDLCISQEALMSLITKQLFYVGSLYPLCSIFRLRKFIQRGWNITAGQILKMAFQVSQLNLTDPKVLEDQLTGVDFAYFIDLVNRLTSDVKEGQSIDAAYIARLVDEIMT